jgi:hypothetical protein
VIDSIAARSMGGPLAIYTMGFIGAYHAVRGQADKAVEWLGRAYEVSPSAFDFRLVQSALFDAVRDDPVFQRGMTNIEARVRARFSGG